LNRFWLALECLGGQAAVQEAWRLTCGPEYPAAQRFLQPTGEVAGCYPRSNPLLRRGWRAPYRIVQLPDGEFLGVPPDDSPAITLPRPQVAVHRLHRQRLVQRIAAAVGFLPECERYGDFRTAFRIGTLTPLAGFAFPILLMFPRGEEDVERLCNAVTAQLNIPFLLLIPTPRFYSSRLRDALRRRGSAVLPLNEALALDDAGAASLTESGKEILDAFLAENLPRAESSPPEFFPTPAGTRWPDVRLRFLDGETLSIGIGDVMATRNYTQLGMASRRNGRPTRQWELLRIFANGHGTLDWSSREADRRHQKQKELLSKRLRRVFRIDEDPFAIAGNGWQTRFTLTPDH